MKIDRRTATARLLSGAAGLGTFGSAGLFGGLAQAQAQASSAAARYPDKPIRFIVNFPAGGTVDVMARTVGQKLGEKWGQSVIVENRPGAGGNIGTQAVATADPDGYTLLVSPPGPLSINQNLYRNLPFDPQKLRSVILLASVPNVITARPDLPAGSVKELIAYAKANPGKVTYASQGNGSTSHLTGQMFATMTGTEMVHVPFKGEGPALNELLAGRVDLFFGNISAVLKFRQDQKVKLLGSASVKRSIMAPDVATVAEGGLPDFHSAAWFAMAAPAGTPEPIVRKLNAAVAEILTQADVREKFGALGGEVVGGSPQEMDAFVQAERERWKKVIASANVTLD
ncbi:Candidate extracytoplasmic binding receptor [Burkholderiales bacterium 8X]|nr:Candidate extracytoplasmic binding receptor [Burkholderiales bacterium 8X]